MIASLFLSSYVSIFFASSHFDDDNISCLIRSRGHIITDRFLEFMSYLVRSYMQISDYHAHI